MTTARRVLTLAGALLLSPLAATLCRAAVTVSASPVSVTAGGDVAVSAQATFRTAPSSSRTSCPLTVSFGDGSAGASASCSNTPCTLSVRHTYPTAGSYLVTAETARCLDPSGAELTSAPLTAEVRVTVTSAPAPTPNPAPNPTPERPVTLTITADPAMVRAPRDRGVELPLTYRASASGLAAALSSPGGTFEAGGAVIATSAAPLELRLSGGTGTATETLRVAPQVLRDAASRGAGSLTYRRDFSGGGHTGRATVTVLIIKPATEFGLERLELAFRNNRPEIVVARGEQGIAAHARVRLAGSGLLQAHWEVDGRVLAPPVSRQVSLGDTVTLSSPELPTFDPGTHEVQLVVSSPSPPLPLPTIVYLVRPGDAAPREIAIRLLAPADGQTLPYEPAVFRWEAAPGAAAFLAQFYAAEGDAPMFSAWTRATEYRLPELLYRDLFAAGKRYRWKVSAYGAGENLAGTSPAGSFGFAP